MRRAAPVMMSMCLAAAVLVFPALGWAGEHESAGGFSFLGGGSHGKAHVCAKCQERLAQQMGGGPVVMSDGMPAAGVPCAACQGLAVAHTHGSVPCAACQAGGMSSSEPPGFASLNGGYPGLGGGTPFSPEPVPVGIMRVNYQQGSQPPMPRPAGVNGAYPMMMPGAGQMGAIPPASAADLSSVGMFDNRHAGRPRLIPRLFGGRARARAEQMAEAHAAMPLGPQGSAPITQLPASVVYGQR